VVSIVLSMVNTFLIHVLIRMNIYDRNQVSIDAKKITRKRETLLSLQDLLKYFDLEIKSFIDIMNQII